MLFAFSQYSSKYIYIQPSFSCMQAESLPSLRSASRSALGWDGNIYRLYETYDNVQSDRENSSGRRKIPVALHLMSLL